MVCYVAEEAGGARFVPVWVPAPSTWEGAGRPRRRARRVRGIPASETGNTTSGRRAGRRANQRPKGGRTSPVSSERFGSNQR